MKNISRWIFLILIVMTFTSCDWLMDVYGIRKKRNRTPEEIAQSEELVEEVQSTELAKLIIKPVPVPLRVKRDPFKPLFEAKKNTSNSSQTEEEEDIFDSVDFLGVVKIGDRFAALLKTPDIKGAFVIGERVGVYTISEIAQEYVVFTKGEKTYKIKRGDEK